MKLIIAGSRYINPSIDEISKYIEHVKASGIPIISAVVSGGAAGVDRSEELRRISYRT